MCGDVHPRFTNCTFSGNDRAMGCFVTLRGSVTIENSILAFSTEGVGVYVANEPDVIVPTLSCCDIYGNAGGDWVGRIADQLGVRDNFSADPLFCDPPQGDYRLGSDSPCAHGPCGLVGAYPVGCTDPQALEPSEGAGMTAGGIRLQRACPNPFSSTARIELVVPAGRDPEPLSLGIFDLSGRLVRTVLEGTVSSGLSTVVWDGRDAGGAPVAPGAYFCRLKSCGTEEGLRLIVIR